MAKKNWKSTILAGGLLLAALPMASAAVKSPEPMTDEQRIAQSVRRELITMPFLSIFDNLTYSVENGVVTLHGQVIRPTLKSEAAGRVKQIAGVTEVRNEIEVLPLSPFDDSLRLAVARRVYGQPALNRYALGAQPPIRIVVRNGNVTLEGVVANEADRNIANIVANGVAGVFSVTNHLQVEKRS